MPGGDRGGRRFRGPAPGSDAGPGPRPLSHPPHPRHPRGGDAAPADAELVQGLRAGLAVFARRRDDILRVVYAEAVRPDVDAVAHWAAVRRVPCAAATEREIDRFAESTHHEGLCLEVRPRRWLPASEIADALLRSGGAAIALDRVRNPYNVGAVVRSAAFFGLEAVILGAPAPHPGLAPTAVRVAEGGAEEVRLARTTDLADTLARVRARGVRVVGADAHATRDALAFDFERPLVVVVGNEREGLADRVRAQCDDLVVIRGSGRVESLNVAVAAGALMARASRPPPAPTAPAERRTR
jgi:TrmH RNA methyltransferase